MRVYLYIFLLAFLVGACNSSTENRNNQSREHFYGLRDFSNGLNQNALQSDVAILFSNIKKPSELDCYYYYHFQSGFYEIKGNYNTALSYADSMLSVLSQLQNVEIQYIEALNTKAQIFRKLSLFDESLKELNAAKIFTDQLNDLCKASEIYFNLGSVLYEKANYTEAIDQYYLLIDNIKACNPHSFWQYVYTKNSALNALGLCYERLDMLDSSRKYYQSSLAFLEQQSFAFEKDQADFFRAARGITLGNFGNTELLSKNYEEAEKMLLSSISINEKDESLSEDVVMTRIKLGILYIRTGKIAEARQVFQQIDSNGHHTPTTFMRICLAKREFYENQENIPAAYNYIQLYIKSQDSVESALKSLLPLSVKDTYSYISQKELIYKLQTEEDKKRSYLIGISLLAFLLLIISYLAYKNLFESRHHVRDLNVLNEEINMQHEQSKKAMKALEKSYEENQQILRVVTHDLRSPISGMISFARVLLLDSGLNEEQKKSLGLIEKIGKDSLRFIEQLLDMKTQVEEQAKTEEDLFELINYCVGFMRIKAEEKKQKIEFSGIPIKLHINRDSIWRVLNNLLFNAIKFSPQGSTIKVRSRVSGNKGIIEIQDEGIGIPEDIQEKVFLMTGEAKRNGTDGEKAFGLGLPISKQIMEAHGGRIWFESTTGKGSTFYLEFPNVVNPIEE